MLCPLWDPIVFTTVEYVLAKVSRKVYNYKVLLNRLCLTFRHHASYIQDRRTATPQSTLFIYLVNKYI